MKNSKTKKSLSILLTLTMLISSLLFTIPASAETASSNIYKASDYFTTATVSNGPWTNQFYDVMTAGLGNGGITLVSGYANMGGTKERGELDGTPTVWVSTMANDAYSWGNNAAYAGANVMRTAQGTTNWTHYNGSLEGAGWVGRNYPVKTFTAPKSGVIKISAATALTATANGTHIRITKFKDTDTNPTNVWPKANNTWQHISGSYDFNDFVIEVEAGEKLTFENAYIKNTELNNIAADTVLYWDPVITYIENDFKSSDFFTTERVSFGPWTNQFYDFMTVGDRNLVSAYTDMGGTKERGELDGTPTVWVSTMANDSYSWGNNAVYVGADVMRTAQGTTNWTHYNGTYENYGWTGRNYAVKTFTAPKSGVIKISAATALTATANGTHIRITKFKTTDTNPINVWPSGDNAWQHISGSYTFSDIMIEVEAGEKVTFENAYIKNTELNNTAADTVLYWDPVVTYVENRFKASDFFSTATVSNGPWANQFYDVMTAGLGNGGVTLVSGYANMGGTKERGELDGTPTVWVSTMANDAYSWGNNAAYAGANVMRTAQGTTNWTHYNGSLEGAGWVGRNYPVKTFTAPKSGVIKISAATALTATANGTHIRITKFKDTDANPTNVWPKANNAWQHISGSYTFSDIEIEVEAGEKIAFENAYIKDATLSNTAADTVLYWDPVVEYADLPYVSSIEFTNASGTKLNDFAEIVAAGTVNVSAVLSCAGLNGVEEATVIVAIYDNNELTRLEAVGLSDTKAIPGGDSETFAFSVENIPALTKGRIKVFIFNDMTSLTPLSDIGSTDYMTAN